MPIFYFHLITESAVSIDHTGIDLPCANTARREAIRSAQELASDALVMEAMFARDAVLEVVDEAGNVIIEALIGAGEVASRQ